MLPQLESPCDPCPAVRSGMQLLRLAAAAACLALLAAGCTGLVPGLPV